MENRNLLKGIVGLNYMKKVKFLVLGGGISGLSFCAFLSKLRNEQDYLIIEKESSVGGLCKSFYNNGFIWDYSGHFLHFKDNEMKKFIASIMPDQLETHQKKTRIYYKNQLISFPFQQNIHQLPKDEFIDCLYDLYFRENKRNFKTFKEMVIGNYGEAISEKFLIPYNEKLYSCDLDSLDSDAMGRFFPHVEFSDIISNFKNGEYDSYNSTFQYPKKGTMQLVNSVLSLVSKEKILLNASAKKIDFDKKEVLLDNDEVISYDYLISTIPLNNFLNIASLEKNITLKYNRVLVFNFGFDKPSVFNDNWIYFPENKYAFYRVGFYDNLHKASKMSLYVEVSFNKEDPIDVENYRGDVLNDLKKVGIIKDHNLIAENFVLMNPAYCHISKESKIFVSNLKKDLFGKSTFLLGRYAEWIYCSIEDNMISARELVDRICK